MTTRVIGVRRAEARDAEAITAVHDAAWRHAYDGMIPAKELNRIIARLAAVTVLVVTSFASPRGSPSPRCRKGL